VTCDPVAVTCTYPNPRNNQSFGNKDAVLVVIGSPLGSLAGGAAEGSLQQADEVLRVWQGSPSDARQPGVYAALRRAGDSTLRSSPVRVSSARPSRQPAFAVDPDRGFLVAWCETDDSSRSSSVVVRRLSPQALPLGAALEITSDKGLTHSSPSVAFAPDGSALVAWLSHDRDSGRSFVEGALVDAGDRIQHLDEALSEVQGGTRGKILVGANEEGAMLVVWEEAGHASREARVRASWMPPGQRAWAPAQDIGFAEGSLLSLAWIGASPTGELWVDWEDQEAGRSLGRFRGSFGPEGRFLGVERLTGPDEHPSPEPSTELP